MSRHLLPILHNQHLVSLDGTSRGTALISSITIFRPDFGLTYFSHEWGWWI